MRTTPQDRLRFREDYHEADLMHRSVAILVPTFTEVSFDEVTQSGINVSSGDGTGRTVASWSVYVIRSRVTKVDQNMKLFGRLALAVDVGDLVFSVKPDQLPIIDSAMKEPHAYVYVDNETFHPTDRNSEGVGFVERWLIGCQRYSPVFRKAGY